MPELVLAWKRRTMVCTGPATYYVVVPVIGAAPAAADALDLISELQRACRSAAPLDRTRVRAVRGQITPTPGRGHHLSIYVTVEHGSGDAHRDGAYVASVLRDAARRMAAVASELSLASDTSPLQRVPQADHRSPDGPPPADPPGAPSKPSGSAAHGWHPQPMKQDDSFASPGDRDGRSPEATDP